MKNINMKKFNSGVILRPQAEESQRSFAPSGLRMTKGRVRQIALLTLFVFMVTASGAYAEPLSYDGGGQQPATAPNVGPGSNRVVPVTYSTNYENQYSPYSSFMASPYGFASPHSQGGATAQYAGAMTPPRGGSADPYNASEISPYSRYSPYIEIIGEGSTYTLGIDDVVTIIVRNQPDFSGRFIVDPEGNIQYNFVGDIPTVGKTKGELKQEIVERLKKYVRYPEVAVMISEYRSKSVYVFGFINRPGKYAMKGDRISVREAVVAAGLPRMDGSLKRVYVIRPSENTESGQAEKKKVNLKKLLEKGDSAENFYLQPGDTIVVKQRYFDKFVNGFSRLVGPLFQAAAVYELGWGQSSGFLAKDKK